VAFDDNLEGGESSVELKLLPGEPASARRPLLISGNIEEGIDHPLAGALFPLRQSRFAEIRFKAKGRAQRGQVGLLTQRNGRKPVLREFVPGPEWTEYVFRLSDFNVVNGREVTGILLLGGPDIGPFAFQVDDFRIGSLP